MGITISQYEERIRNLNSLYRANHEAETKVLVADAIIKDYEAMMKLKRVVVNNAHRICHVRAKWQKNEGESVVESYRLILKNIVSGKSAIYNDIRPKLFTQEDMIVLIDELLEE